MQNNVEKPDLLFVLILMIGMFIFQACGNSTSVKENKQVGSELDKVAESDDGTAYINFRSFQNPDKTWGFTVFVNSMPFRHYNRIPYRNLSKGFVSREEAEKVAAHFLIMINNGDHSPKLNRKLIDSLDITF